MATNKQHTNYARLCRGIIDLGTEVLRDILQSQVSPGQLKNKIHTSQELKSNPLLAEQWNRINNTAITGSYKYFDITLLYKLLRAFNVQELKDFLKSKIPPNQIYSVVQTSSVLVSGPNAVLSPSEINDIKNASSSGSYTKCKGETIWAIIRQLYPSFPPNIVPPTTKWGDHIIPIPSKTTLGDDIERIRVIRNEIYGHIENTEISDCAFKSNWNILEGVMVRMDKLFGSHYKKKLDIIATTCMDNETETFYLQEIERLCKYDQEVKAKIQKVTEELKDTKSEVRKIEKGIKSVKEEVDTMQKDVKTKLEDTEKTLMSQQEEIGNIRKEKREIIAELSSMECNIQKSHLDTKTNIDNLQADIKETWRQQNIAKDTLDKQQTTVALIESSLEHLQTAQENTQTQLESSYKEPKKDMKGMKLSKETKYIQDNTLAMINEHVKDKTFFKTYAVENGIEVLERQGILIYTGRGGEGKSKSSIQIMKQLREKDGEHVVLDIADITQWDSIVNANIKTIVRLDDPLGKTNTESCLVRRCERYWDKIYSCVISGKVKVILTIRENILDENWSELQKFKLFADEHVVNLSKGIFEYPNQHEKYEILKQHCVNNNISFCNDMNDENYNSDLILNKSVNVRICDGKGKTVDEIINTNPLTGFPQTCFLFCKDRKYTRLGSSFFRHPTQSLVKEIKDMRKSKDSSEKIKYCILSYMLLNNGIIDLNVLDDIKLDRIKDSIKFKDSIDKLDIQDALEDIIGQYIVKGRELFFQPIDLSDNISEYSNNVDKLSEFDLPWWVDESNDSDDLYFTDDDDESCSFDRHRQVFRFIGDEDNEKNSTAYVFMHETIFEAVAITFADCNLELLLELCHWKLIEEFVRLHDYKSKEGEIVIKVTPDHKQCLVNRILFEVKNNRFDWFAHTLFDDKAFFDEFKQMAVVSDGESILSKSCGQFDGIFVNALRYGKIDIMDFLWESFRQNVLSCPSLVWFCRCKSVNVLIWYLMNMSSFWYLRNINDSRVVTISLIHCVKNHSMSMTTIVSKLTDILIGSRRYNQIVAEECLKDVALFLKACKYGRTQFLDYLWQYFFTQLSSHDLSKCLVRLSDYKRGHPVRGVIWMLSNISDLRREEVSEALLNCIRHKDMKNKDVASDFMNAICSSDINMGIVANLCGTSNGIVSQALRYGTTELLQKLWERFSQNITILDLSKFLMDFSIADSIDSVIWLLNNVSGFQNMTVEIALVRCVKHSDLLDNRLVSKFTDLINSSEDLKKIVAESCGKQFGIFTESCKYMNINLMNELWRHFQQSVLADDLLHFLVVLSKEKREFGPESFIHVNTAIWLLQNIPNLSSEAVESLIISCIQYGVIFDSNLSTDLLNVILCSDFYRGVVSDSCSKKEGLFTETCIWGQRHFMEMLRQHFEKSVLKCDFSKFIIWNCYNFQNIGYSALSLLVNETDLSDMLVSALLDCCVEYMYSFLREEIKCGYSYGYDNLWSEFEDQILSSETFRERVASCCFKAGGIWDKACAFGYKTLQECLKQHFSDHIPSS